MNWLSLFLLALLAAIAYIQTIQGLVNALIMCVSVLISASVAFATFEWVAFSFLIGPLGDLAMPVAMIGMFLVPLIVLRVVFDMLITRANLLPVLIDRAAASVLGLVTAFVMTGMLAIGIEMVPFGGTFLGHSGVDPETHEENSLWLSPDRFVVSFASSMSGGLFSGSRRWHEDHPDLIQEIAWSHAVPRGVRVLAPPGSVRLVRVESPDYVFDKTIVKKGRRGSPPEITFERNNPPDGKNWYQVRLALTGEAADKDKRHRFTTRQVRLVGRNRKGDPTENFRPIAIDDDENPLFAVRVDDLQLYGPTDGNEVNFVFEVPETFAPEFIEYKVGARVDLSSVKPKRDVIPASDTPDAIESDSSGTPAVPARTSSRRSADARAPGKPGRRRGGGRVSGAQGSGSNSKFSDRLPMEMTRYRQSDLDQKNGVLVNGHVWGNVDNQGQAGTRPRLQTFDVPADKRLFHLDVKQLQARSTFGRALSFTVTSLKQYFLHDDTGRVYPVVGQFVVADVDGTEVIEIQYYPEQAQITSRGGVRAFQRVKKRHLRGSNYRLVYLFLVEPGAKLTEFTTGAGRRPTDLSRDNLVAPG